LDFTSGREDRRGLLDAVKYYCEVKKINVNQRMRELINNSSKLISIV